MKIIVGTDGSEFSRAAIDACCDLVANLEGAEIKIIAAYEMPAPIVSEPFAIYGEAYQQVADVVADLAKHAAETAVAMIQERVANQKVNLSTRVELGRPARVIIETAEEWNADLIVVGSHGHGFWGRAMLGSVSDAVVHHAGCSVLVVRRS